MTETTPVPDPAAAPVAAPAPVLSVSGLSVRYKARIVLDHLDLTLEPGSIYGLLGPNGAGKTTLVRAICGRIRPEQGTILIAGRSNLNRKVLRHIGLVPQEIALYPRLSIHENLETFARLSGLDRGRTREAIRWAAAATRLDSRARERVELLSGGWKRRVNIAAAILHRPALLILDEPTVGVDVDARNELHEVISGLAAQGMAVLLTTHDLDQAETLATRIGFLTEGRIAPEGAPRELLARTFGDQREILIELRRAPTEDQAQRLRLAGFNASGHDMSWSAIGHTTTDTAENLTGRLAEMGLVLREFRLREPGLDALFLRLSRGSQRANDNGADT